MADFRKPGVVYAELQRFGQKWLWWLVGASLFLPVIPLLLSLKGEEFFIFIPYLIISFLSILLMRKIGLKTEVREDGFYYRFLPIHLKTYSIPWEDVVSYEIVTYKPIADYGGWGIRYGFLKQGRAYNVSGNKGMKLYLKNGKQILFGTQNPKELQEAMLHIFKTEETDDFEDIDPEQAFDLNDKRVLEKEKLKLKDDGHQDEA